MCTDDSEQGGYLKLRKYLTAEELQQVRSQQYRVRFVNVWRSLVPVVEDLPLALCDRRSIAKSDVADVDKIHEDYVGEGSYLKHRPYHKWYWLPWQTKDEAFMFITWDTRTGADHPAVVPHGAFDMPNPDPAAMPRQSIDARYMVITKE